MIKIQGGALASEVWGLSRPTKLMGEPCSWRITGCETEDARHGHEQRKVLLDLLCRSLTLTEAQIDAAKWILGEAINNTYFHGVQGEDVIIYCLAMASRFIVILDSPSAERYVGDFSSQVDDNCEHGRGRIIMEGFAEDLKKSHLNIVYHYEYQERVKSPGRTILRIVFSR